MLHLLLRILVDSVALVNLAGLVVLVKLVDLAAVVTLVDLEAVAMAVYISSSYQFTMDILVILLSLTIYKPVLVNTALPDIFEPGRPLMLGSPVSFKMDAASLLVKGTAH